MTEIKEGDTAHAQWGGGNVGGKVVEKKEDGKLEIESKGKKVSKQGEPGNAAFHLKRSGNDVVKKESELTKDSDGGKSGKSDKAEEKKEDKSEERKEDKAESKKSPAKKDENKEEKSASKKEDKKDDKSTAKKDDKKDDKSTAKKDEKKDDSKKAEDKDAKAG